MTRRPAITAGVLLIVALVLYGSDLSPSPSPLRAEEVALARQAYSIAQTGHDLDGRTLPLYVHGEGDVWFPPLPAYAAVIAAALVPASAAAVRWPSVVAGVLTILLVYRFGLKLFGDGTRSAVAAAIALLSPALYMWSRLAFDGIFAVPFVLTSMLYVLLFLDKPQPSYVWLAGLALGIGFYASTTAPILMPIYLVVAVVTIWMGGHTRPAVYVWLAIGFLLPLLCLVPWFAMHPESYPDTLGRWAIHAAHVRNPLDGLRAIINWGSLTNRTSVYWEFLNPAYLFFPADQNSVTTMRSSGPFLFPLLLLVPIGIARIVRTRSSSVATLLLVGLLVAPLAGSTFGENHAFGRVLVLIPFVALVATFGVERLWMLGRAAGRIAAGLLLVSIAVQFAIFHREYVAAYHRDAARSFQDQR